MKGDPLKVQNHYELKFPTLDPGCQINSIDVNFNLQNSFEIFDKNSADKIWSRKDKEITVSPLMPIRVKLRLNKVGFIFV